jgi:hypothetical protein
MRQTRANRRLLVQVYIERHFPAKLKRHYTNLGKKQGVSFQGACVEALGRHFGIPYQAPRSLRTTGADPGKASVVLKVPLPLKKKIDVRAAQQGRFQWEVVIDALEDEAAAIAA